MLGASHRASPAAMSQGSARQASTNLKSVRGVSSTPRRSSSTPCSITPSTRAVPSSGNSSTGPSSTQAGLSPTAARILSGASAGPAPRLIIPSNPAPTPGGLILPSNSTIRTSSPSSVATAAAAAAAPAISAPSRGHGMDGPIVYFGSQRVHSLSERGKEVVRSMADWAAVELPKFLKPTERHWQPTDMLPDSASPDFYDQVMSLRSAASNLPNEYLVVLVGDMITEEALPSYMNMINTLDEVRDETGADDTPWAHWTRQWTAEENRHGDVLNKYLWITGRVDMHSIETTIQRLISSGLDPRLENNPYLCFVYTSFQERATRITHGNTARLALYHGDAALGRLCGAISADEARHELAYQAIIAEVLRRDPDGGVLAFADMMKKGIVMPAHFVDDGWHTAANGPKSNLFQDYASVADGIGVYTANDYAGIVDHLVRKWDIANVRVESGEAAEAQEFLMHHSQRIRRLADLQMERRLRDRKRGKSRTAAFSWVFKREVAM
ncbi:hypothetical protein Agub_g5492 [Astrephomene gubernaculifera]|uniref:Acyl-[acyl-carrier-protein] desaturase n=1 Tax=Astrephomene gubernaculifera TaxID=47775 RepID=A0AAD3HL25_9CHLO|nr:hypothetical protein Agub_g5492 [Astrephomene gubernaculifera]